MEEIDLIINQMEKLLGRLKECQSKYGNNKSKTVKISDLFLNKITYEVNVQGEIRTLTRSEYSLIKELLDSENMFCSYEKLCTVLYGYELDDSSIKSLAVMVLRLRNKLKDLINIKVVRNKGYIITEVKGYDKSRLL